MTCCSAFIYLRGANRPEEVRESVWLSVISRTRFNLKWNRSPRMFVKVVQVPSIRLLKHDSSVN